MLHQLLILIKGCILDRDAVWRKTSFANKKSSFAFGTSQLTRTASQRATRLEKQKTRPATEKLRNQVETSTLEFSYHDIVEYFNE